MSASCASCTGTATSTGGGGAQSPPSSGAGGDGGTEHKPEMNIVCHYEFELDGKSFKGGTTKSESHPMTSLPPEFAGCNIRRYSQHVDHITTTDGLQFKVFYNDDVFGSAPNFRRLLDKAHDIALIEVRNGVHFLARTEPILGGRLGLAIINARRGKTLLIGQGDVVSAGSGGTAIYLSFDLVYPWLSCA